MKTQLKDIFREIKKSRNRFLSILAIIAIGVGFFCGVKVTCPDMEWTAEKYFEDQNLMDAQLKSTMGFTADDIQALGQDENVDQISAGYTADFFVAAAEGTSHIVRTYSADMQELKDGTGMNRPVLKEGRWPEQASECLVESGIFSQGTYHLGSTITLLAEDADVHDTLTTDTFTVVGVIESPMYISFERGSSTIGNGKIDSFMLLPKEAYAYEVYTDVFLTFKDMAPFYEDSYNEQVEGVLNHLEGVADQREDIRFRNIHDEAMGKLDEAKAELDSGWQEYQNAKADFESQIADGESKLAQAQKQLTQGKQDYEAGAKAYYEGRDAWEANQAKLLNAKTELDQNQKKLDQSKAEIEGLEQSVTAIRQGIASEAYVPQDQPLPQALSQVIAAAQALEKSTGVSGLSAGLEQYFRLASTAPEKAQTAQTLLAYLTPLDQTITDGKQEIQLGKKQLQQGLAEWEQNNQQLQEAKKQLDDTENKLSAARLELSEGQKQLDQQKAQLESGKREGQQQLEQAKVDLESGQAEYQDGAAEIEKIDKPTWYLFDRSNQPGYSGYLEDAARVDKIAAVFPVFFILVAGLVCLTTMTRMVEEKRTEIGTEKALGYSKSVIMLKYLVYAGLASLFGSIIGLAVGFKLFPFVIFNAYRIMYIMPPVLLPIRWDYALACTGVAMVCTCLAAFFACYQELRGCPAKMMRPKAPKIGKRVLLERITFIWKRLSFLQKVTARNLFRYKKRIFMTIVGVAGCTALLLTGFGLQHSIASMADKQYGEIFQYDLLGVYNEEIDAAQHRQVIDGVRGHENISNAMVIRQQSVDVSHVGVTKNIYLVVPETTEQMNQYIALQNRQSGEKITIPEKGAVITEKISRLLKLKIGDSITLHRNDGEAVQLPITAITENYTMNYIYLSPEQYAESYGHPVVYNAFFANAKEMSKRSEMSAALLQNENILALNFSEDNGQQFTDVVGSLNYVVLVLILSAGALAFVVLYNLSNINVTERVREIATIKVLGFYDVEVSKYINRENTLSALLGVVAGLFVGVPFERFVVQTAEIDAVMFIPGVNFMSFVLAIALTIFFTLIVNFTMTFVLRKVNMVESLKSVE